MITSVFKALLTVQSRNGHPQEDDWELMEAAEVLARNVNMPITIQRVSTARLKRMSIDETIIFSEPENTKNAGAPSQGYATRSGVRITTSACLVVIPGTAQTIKAVMVTRIA